MCEQVHVAIAVNLYHLQNLRYPYPAEQETVVLKEFKTGSPKSLIRLTAPAWNRLPIWPRDLTEVSLDSTLIHTYSFHCRWTLRYGTLCLMDAFDEESNLKLLYKETEKIFFLMTGHIRLCLEWAQKKICVLHPHHLQRVKSGHWGFSLLVPPPFELAPQFQDSAYSGDTSWMNVGNCGQGLSEYNSNGQTTAWYSIVY